MKRLVYIGLLTVLPLLARGEEGATVPAKADYEEVQQVLKHSFYAVFDTEEARNNNRISDFRFMGTRMQSNLLTHCQILQQKGFVVQTSDEQGTVLYGPLSTSFAGWVFLQPAGDKQ